MWNKDINKKKDDEKHWRRGVGGADALFVRELFIVRLNIDTHSKCNLQFNCQILHLSSTFRYTTKIKARLVIDAMYRNDWKQFTVPLYKAYCRICKILSRVTRGENTFNLHMELVKIWAILRLYMKGNLLFFKKNN